jgi:hypothetical protein
VLQLGYLAISRTHKLYVETILYLGATISEV